MYVKKVQTDRDSSIERLLRDTLLTRTSKVSDVADTSDTGTDRCLDTVTLAAWAERTLGSRERSRAEAHAADCARCQAMLAAMTRTTATTVVAPWWRVHLMRWMVPVSAAAALIVWSVLPARPTFDTSERAKQIANAEPAASPQSTARAEARVPEPMGRPVAPEGTKREAPQVEEKGQALRDAGVEFRRADAREDKPANAALATPEPPTRSIDAVGETRAKAMAEAVAVTPPPPPAAAVATAAPPPPASASPPAAPERSAFGAAQAAPQVATDRLMTRQLAVVQAPPIVSPNSLNRWRLVPGGAVQHSTNGGSTWQIQQTGATTTLTAGASPSPLVCWLVGPRGLVLLSTDGATWKHVSLSDTIDLVSVRATDDKTATVTASDGRTLNTADGGATWRRP